MKKGDIVEVKLYVEIPGDIVMFEVIAEINTIFSNGNIEAKVLKINWYEERLELIKDEFLKVGDYVNFVEDNIIEVFDNQKRKEAKASSLLNELCATLRDGDSFRLDNKINLTKKGDYLIFGGSKGDGDECWTID